MTTKFELDMEMISIRGEGDWRSLLTKCEWAVDGYKRLCYKRFAGQEDSMGQQSQYPPTIQKRPRTV
jgi:hypothetical protein